MLQIVNTSGETVRQSQNLALIGRHCNATPIVAGRKLWRKRGAPSLILVDLEGKTGAVFQIAWGNGDTLKSTFASAAVCVDWMTSRRFLFGAELSISAKIWDEWLNPKERKAIERRYTVCRVAKGARIFLSPK